MKYNDISKKMKLEDRGDLIEVTILENTDYGTTKSEFELEYDEALLLIRVLSGLIREQLIPYKELEKEQTE